MKRVLAVLLVEIISFTTLKIVEPRCGPNEELKDQGSHCEDCSNYYYVTCALQNVTECYCKEGYIRTSSNDSECVKIENCPSRCPENQVFVDCHTNHCQSTCQAPYPKSCIDISLCITGCLCGDGYILSQNVDGARCVSVESCKDYCLEGQEYNNCGSACPPTCVDPTPEVCTEPCVPGCFCKKGVYDEQANKCVANATECTRQY